MPYDPGEWPKQASAPDGDIVIIEDCPVCNASTTSPLSCPHPRLNRSPKS